MAQRIVIVGAGFGGLATVRGLRDVAADVTVIDRRNYHLFQPLLYQVATAALGAEDIAVPIRAALNGQGNTTVLMDEVTAVDTGRRQVSTRSGRQEAYDYLVLATGSVFNYFGHADWAEHAPSIKSLDNARLIRGKILSAFERAEMVQDELARRRLLTFVLIGGGATGVELAGAMSELARGTLVRDFRHIDPSQARIVLAEAGSKLLAGYPDALPEYARHSLQRMGVEVHLNTEIKAIDDRGVTTKRGRIDAATVLWCAGVKATPDLSLADHPEIFVIGDAAVVHGADGKPLPGLAAVAKQQGGYVARALVDRLAGRTAAPFRYRDRGTLAVIGRHSGVANLPHFKSTGVLAWLLWAIVHLYFLIGGRNRLAVFLNWAWAWLTYQRGSRLILSGGSAEPSNTDSPRKPEEFAHGQHD